MHYQRSIPAAVLIVGSFLTQFFAQDLGPQNEERLAKGKQLITEERLPEAVELLSLLKQDAPLDARAYFYSALALAQMNKLSAAAADLKEAVRLEPDNLHQLILYADVSVRLKQDEVALGVLAPFEDRSKLESLTSAWLWLLSETYIRADDNDSGLEVLALIGAKDPDNLLVDLNRGIAYFKQGKYEQSLESVEESLRKKVTDNPDAHFYRGKLLKQMGDMKGARKAYLEAVNQDPGNFKYLWRLGAVCLALGNHEEAITYLERAKPGVDEFPEIYYSLGRAYQAVKDQSKAREALKQFQAVTKQGREREYDEIQSAELVGKGVDALDRNDLVEARNLFTLATEKNPENWTAHGHLAELALSEGALYQAYPHLQKMEKINPSSATGQYLMARYWYAYRNYPRARDYAEKARQVRPSNSSLRNLLGNIYLSLGQVNEAVQEYSAAVDLDPNRPEFKLNLEAARKRLQ